jgi:hypothetical protein
MKNLKDTLTTSLGNLGVILYGAVAVLLVFAPLVVLQLPFWLNGVLVVCLFLPWIGGWLRLALYIWAMTALSGVSTGIVFLFWISFGLFFIGQFVPFLLAFWKIWTT